MEWRAEVKERREGKGEGWGEVVFEFVALYGEVWDEFT